MPAPIPATYKGERYSSQKAACAAAGATYSYVKKVMTREGCSFEKAVDFVLHEMNTNNRCHTRKLVCEGVTYKNIQEMADHYKVSKWALKELLTRHMPEKALNILKDREAARHEAEEKTRLRMEEQKRQEEAQRKEYEAERLKCEKEKIELKATWSDLYKYWMKYTSAITRKLLQYKHIHVDCEKPKCIIYRVAWCNRERYSDRDKIDARSIPYSKSTEGLKRTLMLLCQAKTDEQRAAIWLSAFLFEVLTEKRMYRLNDGINKLMWLSRESALHSLFTDNTDTNSDPWYYPMNQGIPKPYTIYIKPFVPDKIIDNCKDTDELVKSAVYVMVEVMQHILPVQFGSVTPDFPNMRDYSCDDYYYSLLEDR